MVKKDSSGSKLKGVWTFNDFITYLLPILAIFGIGKSDSKNTGGGAFDFLSGKDEGLFMEDLSDVEDLGKRKIMEKWLLLDKDLGHLFRKFVTSNPNKKARVKIITSYIEEPDDQSRTSRFGSEVVPPWFFRRFRKLFKEKTWKRIVEKIPELSKYSASGLTEGLADVLETPTVALEDWVKKEQEIPKWKRILCIWRI